MDTREHGSTHGAWIFFGITLGLTGLLWGAAAASGQEWTAFPANVLYVAGGVVPSATAFALVWRSGRDRLRRFLRRGIDPRTVSPHWYAIILAIALGPALLSKLVAPGSDAPSEAGAFGIALVLVAVLAALAKEYGWRGHATDRLLEHHRGITASLIIGIAWTVWHLPLYFIDGTVQHDAGLWSNDFWFDMAARIPLSVLFMWIVLGCGGSIFSAVLLHAVDNIASVVIDPRGDQVAVRFAVVVLLAIAVAVASRRMWRTGAVA